MNTIKLGTFEIIQKDKEYKNYSEFINTYSKETPNSEGIRIATYKEANYLLQEFKKLKISKSLEKYYYTLVTEIVIRYELFGVGDYKEAIIDDPSEIIKFHEGEAAYGYDSDGSEIEFTKGSSKIDDWSDESSVFFLVRSL